MGTLQKINLGTPPKGADGDNNRVAHVKMNVNVDVLDRQAALVSAPMITASLTLGEGHIGRRVSINIAAGGTVKLRKASLCEPDSIVWLVNVGAKRVLLAPDDGSGDSVQISGLGPGEAAALDTDGVSAWRVLVRGRASADDESVVGNLSIGGAVAASGEVQSKSKTAFRAVAGSYGVFLRNDASKAYLQHTKAGDQYGSGDGTLPFYWDLVTGKVTIDGTGVGCAIGSRPTFAGKVAWDEGNMTRPALFSASGGNQSDLNPNAYENRLAQSVVCGAAGTIMATATAALNLAAGVAAACDVVARIRITDGPTVVFDGPDDLATVIVSDAGYGGRGKIVAMAAATGLVPGKTYTVQFLITKTAPVGPLYPLYMRMVGSSS
jgi:hypothetical protein